MYRLYIMIVSVVGFKLLWLVHKGERGEYVRHAASHGQGHVPARTRGVHSGNSRPNFKIKAYFEWPFFVGRYHINSHFKQFMGIFDMGGTRHRIQIQIRLSSSMN